VKVLRPPESTSPSPSIAFGFFTNTSGLSTAEFVSISNTARQWGECVAHRAMHLWDAGATNRRPLHGASSRDATHRIWLLFRGQQRRQVRRRPDLSGMRERAFWMRFVEGDIGFP